MLSTGGNESGVPSGQFSEVVGRYQLVGGSRLDTRYLKDCEFSRIYDRVATVIVLGELVSLIEPEATDSPSEVI